MPLPDSIVDCDSTAVDPSDPLCERAQNLFSSGANFCTYRNWHYSADGTEISDDFLTMMSGGVAAGVYGSATQIPVITFDAFGRPTSVTLVAVDTGSPIDSVQVHGNGATTFTPPSTGFSDVTFSSQSPVVNLPSAGRYRIDAIIGFGASVGQAYNLYAKFYNQTTAADIPLSLRQALGTGSGAYVGQLILSNTIDVVAACSITIRASREDIVLGAPYAGPVISGPVTSISYLGPM